MPPQKITQKSLYYNLNNQDCWKGIEKLMLTVLGWISLRLTLKAQWRRPVRCRCGMSEQALPRVLGLSFARKCWGWVGAEHTATSPRTLSQESLIPLVECYFQVHQLALSGLSPGQKPLSRVVAVEFLCKGQNYSYS